MTDSTFAKDFSSRPIAFRRRCSRFATVLIFHETHTHVRESMDELQRLILDQGVEPRALGMELRELGAKLEG